MKWNRTSNNTMLRSQRILLPLIVLAVLLAILALSSAAKPVYADSPPDEWIWPGEGGGGGGGGGGYPTYDIQGQVFNLRTSAYAVGVTVCVYNPFRELMGSATTDGIGAFRIVNYGMYPYCRYQITLNGHLSELGTSTIDPQWCQWSGYVVTDALVHAYTGGIYLDRSTVVVSAAATLYSNTQYTQKIDYSTSSSHDLTYQVNVGFVGYRSSGTHTQGITWSIVNQRTAQFGNEYYAAGWLRNDIYGGPYISHTGLAGLVDPLKQYRTFDVEEYLTPNLQQPNYGLPTGSTPTSFTIRGNDSITYTYVETSSVTWSYGFSGSVGVNFYCFGVSVNLDVTATVSSSHTNTITLIVGPLPSGTPYHTFVLYTKGFSFTEPNGSHEDPANRGGLELHVWDMGVT